VRSEKGASEGEGVRMKGIKTVSLGLALSSFIVNAWGEEICARAPDITAMQAAAVQQELMVAAFSCNDFGLYNSFVVTYQKALQDSDKALEAYFLRRNADTGAADYHSFKTKLANSYSLRSSDDAKVFCGRTLRVFRAALNEGPKTLAEFVMAQPVSFTHGYDSCGEQIAGGAMLARGPELAVAAAPVPVPAVATAAATPAAIAAVVPAMTEPKPIPEARTLAEAAPLPRNTEIIAPPAPEQRAAPTQNVEGQNAGSYNVGGYSARNNTQRYVPPPPPRDPRVRRYDARDAYPPPPRESGYSTRYGERDPYYRNAYDRWYEYYYYRRR